MDERETRRLFEEAARRAPAERASFLDEATRGAPALRAEVEALLAQDRDASAPFSTPPLIEVDQGKTIQTARASAKRLDELAPGTRLGRYVIRERIGAGGFAIVYLADQEEPVRRQVALKVLRRGLGSDEVLARFEAERQALALMDHPNVACVFDAGTTGDDRPFFVMEHVAGESITEYCDRHRLPNRKRLRLFVQACDAVQHAHQKGIIHRDVKPSNILVTVKGGRPFVKVIDFGVAKAITARLTDRTIHTRRGQAIGTPAYMSPEQAEMTALDIDTRSDVYSLGVVMYQLLTGLLPFDPMSEADARSPEIQRIIREEQPAAPSTRLSELDESTAEAAAAHNARPRTLRELRGDLDCITLKALEKDRTNRYATAAELALDIERYLAGEPILAKSLGVGRRLRRIVKVQLLAVASLLVVLIAVAPMFLMFPIRSTGRSPIGDAVVAQTSKKPGVLVSPDAADVGQPQAKRDRPAPSTSIADASGGDRRRWSAVRSGDPADTPSPILGAENRPPGTWLWSADETMSAYAEAREIRRQLLDGTFPPLATSRVRIAGMTVAEVDVRLVEVGLARLLAQPSHDPEQSERLEREYELLVERRAVLFDPDDAADRKEDVPSDSNAP